MQLSGLAVTATTGAAASRYRSSHAALGRPESAINATPRDTADLRIARFAAHPNMRPMKLTDTVIITGTDIEVDHQTEGHPDPKRRRPQAYNPPKSTVDLGDVIERCGQGNPFWSDEANRAAEESDETPRRLAKAWRKHRIETP